VPVSLALRIERAEPVFDPLTIFAVKPGNGSADLMQSQQRTAFLPPATQVFTYDLDGNLTSDGVWTYSWDAENRLWAMETTASAIAGGVPARRLEFKYDHMHRRVEKLVRGGWNGSTFTTIVSHHRYLYDGWNLVAEFSVASVAPLTLTLTRSYTWGLDITADLTKAGGVGALLQIADHATGKTYLPSYDGNGNIVALFDSATTGGSAGVCVAAYEYSPFGEFLRSEGTYATENPFRFSTKFTDDETGFVYYGRRYYSPSQGRFLGRDRIEEGGGLNLYGFCTNDTINR
jgi:RHS repeat-associated protein